MKAKPPGTIEGLFEGRPASLALFNVVRKYVESLGPVKVEATRAQVSFGAKTKFAWVWLPQLWVRKRSETSISLTFDLGHRIDDPRIASAVEPLPGRFSHYVVIERASDLDAKVRAWLREAYEFGTIDRRPGRLNPIPGGPQK
jgi:hypothetical protein